MRGRRKGRRMQCSEVQEKKGRCSYCLVNDAEILLKKNTEADDFVNGDMF